MTNYTLMGVVRAMWHIFTARRYASAVYAVVVCVCPSVCHKLALPKRINGNNAIW